MIHFLYLVGFAILAGLVLGAISSGDRKTKLLYGLKIFGQFTLISLALAWIFYFIPW
jgi:hypothetical protein